MRPGSVVLAVLLGSCGGGGGTVTPDGGGPGGGNLGNCPIFPADNWWNRDISGAAIDPSSDAYIASMGRDTALHADYGADFGIPFVAVTGNTSRSAVSFSQDDESDSGPYPIPANPPVEGGDDAHILMIETDECKLYELYAVRQSGSQWSAYSGAIFDLRSNARRTDGYTSADAAGLAIFPGLVRYDEVASGEIRHAIRFTATRTRDAYVWPASHSASAITDPNVPPMGIRVRLKPETDITALSPEAQVVARALKKYGAILADNGSNWFFSGAPDPRWDDDDLHALGRVTGADFEVVDTSRLRP
jgi:hypothetical protein